MPVENSAKSRQYSIFERYTDAAQSALAYARIEAELRGSDEITVADLLAGLSVNEGTRADRVGALKLNAFYLRWLSGLPALPRAGVSTEQVSPELNLEAKKALGYAVVEADRDREYWIDSDHLLRGLLSFPNKADFALLKTEINLDSARICSRRDREENLPEENPSLKVIQYLTRKHIALWVPSILSLACYLYILIQGIELSPLTR